MIPDINVTLTKTVLLSSFNVKNTDFAVESQRHVIGF